MIRRSLCLRQGTRSGSPSSDIPYSLPRLPRRSEPASGGVQGRDRVRTLGTYKIGLGAGNFLQNGTSWMGSSPAPQLPVHRAAENVAPPVALLWSYTTTGAPGQPAQLIA